MRIVCDFSSELKGHNLMCDNFFILYKLGQLLLNKPRYNVEHCTKKKKTELSQQISNKANKQQISNKTFTVLLFILQKIVQ